jgi:hypothetical protein
MHNLNKKVIHKQGIMNQLSDNMHSTIFSKEYKQHQKLDISSNKTIPLADPATKVSPEK